MQPSTSPWSGVVDARLRGHDVECKSTTRSIELENPTHKQA